MTTIRDMVRDIQVEMRDTDLQPSRAAELLSTAAALIGNCNDEIRQSDVAYGTVLLRELDSGGAANRAKIRAQITPEYMRAREAKDTKELVVELVRALKYIMKSMGEEYQAARYQA